MVSGWWVLNSTTTAFKGLSAIANASLATVSASTLGSNIPALNMAYQRRGKCLFWQLRRQ